MKRYDHYTIYDDYGNCSTMEEEPAGEWVKYSEAEGKIKEKDQEINQLLIDYDIIRKFNKTLKEQNKIMLDGLKEFYDNERHPNILEIIKKIEGNRK